jgi:cell wall assembly regulator SMI1
LGLIPFAAVQTAKQEGTVIKQFWADIDAILAEHDPEALASYLPGATPHTLQELAKAIGRPLPPELAEHLRIHDGQPRLSPFGLDSCAFLSSSGIAQVHKELCESLASGAFEGLEAVNNDGKVKADWWNRNWIPFMQHPLGGYRCVDMDPGPNGKPGQIIMWWDENEDRDVYAESLTGQIERCYNDLTNPPESVFIIEGADGKEQTRLVLRPNASDEEPDGEE